MRRCEICRHSEHNKVHIVSEMMFGTRESFEYIECVSCGCIQIADIPDNISRYYPPDYISNQEPYRFGTWRDKFIASQIAKHSLNGVNPIGWWYRRKYPSVAYPQIPRIPIWLVGNKLRLKKKSKVLDVGCAAGALLYEMRELLGIKSLTGIDPFIESDRRYDNGVRVIKADLGDVNDQFDLIMLHHSLEHMPDQLSVLKRLRNLLRPEGRVLIRIPICSSFAWRNYGVHWVQLDAPRHFFIHSLTSLRILAGQSGFQIKETVYDSFNFQFWASEQYKMGIPLTSSKSYSVCPENSMFTQNQIDEFTMMAKELNEREDGDQACFILEAA